MECRVGYTVDLQFTLNQEDYFFDTLEAVSTTDETQSRADYVEITFNEKASDQSKGIYKYTVKLLKYADDILIRPKCVVLPRGIMHTPDTSDSQYSNTPIILYFNIPVEDEDTTLENSLFTYDNISLLYEDVNKEIIDMSSYFYEPEFNKDKTVLKLIPSGAKIQQLLKQKDLPFITIQVNLSENITVENQGYTFNLRQDNNTNFSVVYNSIGETIPPERKSGDLFYLTKEPITFSSAPLLPDEDKFLQTTYDKNNYEENVKRVVPGTFNIYGRYYDGGSGVRSVEVRETFVKTLNNTETNDSRYPVEFTAKSNEAQFFDEGNGYTTFIIQYTLQEFMLESPRGGIFNIDICIKDGCDNSSLTESFTIINLEYGALNYLYEWYEDGPQVPALANCSFYVYNTSFSISETNSNAYDFEKYNSDIKTIRIKDKTHPTRYCIGGNWSSFVPATEVNYLCEYIDKSGQKRLESFSPFNSQLMERTLTLDVKSVSGVSFTVFAVYNDTIIGRKQFSFPPFPKAEFIDSTEVGLDSLSGNIYRFFGICQNDDGSYNIIYPTTAEYSTTLPDSKNCYFGYFSFLNHIYEEDYTFLTKYYEYNSETNSFTEYDNPVNPYDYEFENNESTVSLKQSTNKRFRNGLVGELMGPFYNGQEQIPIPDSSIIEEYSISNALQKGMCEINLTFGSDLWEKYDSLSL